jgi:hypothetical protein
MMSLLETPCNVKFRTPARPKTEPDRSRLIWKGDHLCRGNIKTGLSVVPDAVHAGMWRIRYPDGSLSDIVNRTRAKDAAEYSHQRYRDYSPAETSPVRFSEGGRL